MQIMSDVYVVGDFAEEIDARAAATRRKCHGALRAGASQACTCDRRLPDGRRTSLERAQQQAETLLKAHYAVEPEQAWRGLASIREAGERFSRAGSYATLESVKERQNSNGVGMKALNSVLRARFRRECHGLWRTGRDNECWCDRGAIDAPRKAFGTTPGDAIVSEV